jgi:hypothetical protein
VGPMTPAYAAVVEPVVGMPLVGTPGFPHSDWMRQTTVSKKLWFSLAE